MKKSVSYLLLSLILAFTACRNSKDITMFQAVQMEYESIPLEPKEHKITPNDILYIRVLTLDQEVNQLFNPSLAGNGLSSGTEQMYGSPTSRFINGYKVSADSTITLPIVGEIKLVGLSLERAQEYLKERAQEYLKEPTVQVKLINFKINVSGELREPGIYYNYEGKLTIYDAISMASGITEFADLKNVVVKRETSDNIITYNLDLTNNSVYYTEAFNLQPNDLVYIPPSKLKRRTQNNDTYSRILSTVSVILVAAALFLSL
ncbi:polysaccharide biosynthesis/export family protein [uncultured Draconibacterium sp.]|uniref:polysaccharide biosynthesis/export family protein n=1 Tax=uncultured Draconibacterium sp. TaxID=1573823 RepID=UPI002AA8BE99|nr:polysaccharide biosynthesis/export family protein [uncultured Draconibacterium sp.]